MIDEARVRALMPTPTTATASTEAPLPPLTADAIAEIEAMVRDKLAVSGYPVPKWTPNLERKEVADETPAEVPATAEAKALTGTCDVCDCRVKAGMAIQMNKCFNPEQEDCFFRQARVAVPEHARSYTEQRTEAVYDSTAEGVTAEAF
jgi:hypothetical protein